MSHLLIGTQAARLMLLSSPVLVQSLLKYFDVGVSSCTRLLQTRSLSL